MGIYAVKQAAALFSDLVHAAQIDSEINSAEAELLSSMAEELSVPIELAESVLEESIPQLSFIPSDPYDRAVQFHRIMIIMRADEPVNIEEKNLLHKIARHYEIDFYKVEHLLNKLEEDPIGEIAPQELLDIHKISVNYPYYKSK